MAIDIGVILKALEEIMALYEKIETAVQSEADLKKRARLLKALQERNLDEIRKILFEV